MCPQITTHTVTESLPVFFILFNFLPMGDFIPNSSTTLNETECSQVSPAQTASDILTAQVGMRNGNVYTESVILQKNPVRVNFTFDTVGNSSSYHCVFWNFSDP